MTCVVELLEGAPYSAEEILAALDQPARPLFLGRTSCPPETRVAGGTIAATSLAEAVTFALTGGAECRQLYLPVEAAEVEWGDVPVSIPGTRDWAAQRHSGVQSYILRSLVGQGEEGLPT
jgi:hypothetical protein